MKTITYKDLQIDIEREYFSRITENINRLFSDAESENRVDLNEERHFHNLVKHALDMEGHVIVESIIERIKKNLCLESILIKFYLYQDDVFNVNCFARRKGSHIKELYVFVSQHFFNNLNEDEQISIIGHEIAHHLFNHLKYPTASILGLDLDVNRAGDLKLDLIYWSKLKEINADLIGLVSSNFHTRNFSTALIKYATGLSQTGYNEFTISSLIEMELQQYENFAKDPFLYDLQSTHPLMPLRVKIINEISDLKLIQRFGEKVKNSEHDKYRKEFNDSINKLILDIYPEVFPTKDAANDVLILMSIAVILADGIIDVGEIEYMNKLLESPQNKFEKYTNIIFEKQNSKTSEQEQVDYTSIINELTYKSVNITKKKSFNRNMVVPIIRKLILVSASDGTICKKELDVIYHFSKEFSISRRDIILILSTQYKV